MKSLLSIVFFFLSTLLFAQPYGNEWINASQTYVKFPINKEGIYRINRDDLVRINNGFLTVNPKNIQIFGKGKEQAIYVYGENDLSFDSGDYIEFYAEANDGFFDKGMYKNADEQSNPYYSLVNDTLYYYITWKDSPEAKKRIRNYSSADYDNYTAINKVQVSDLYQYTNAFYWGQRVSPYSSGKGWFDNKTFVYGAPITKSFTLNHRISTSDVQSYFSVCGAPNSSVYTAIKHHLKISYNSEVMYDTLYKAYENAQSSFTIDDAKISSETLNLKFSANIQDDKPDRNVIAYVKLKYSRDLDFNAISYASFSINPISETRKLTLQNFTNDNTVLYNLSLNERTFLKSSGSDLSAIIHNSTQESKIVVSTKSKIIPVTKFINVKIKDYKNLSEEPDYIIISHSSLTSVTNEYVVYRQAQGYKVLNVDIDNLYNQFSYGINKHPLAIRNFLAYITSKYKKPHFLFLIGKAIHTRDFRKNTEAYKKCLVPTMGNPSSDNLFSADFVNDKSYPTIATGRIAVRNTTELSYYLNKVKEYEQTSPAIWQKNVIHFGGGGDINQQTRFKNYLLEYQRILEDTLWGGYVSTFLKHSSDAIQISVSDSISRLINNGVGLITFFGHGYANGFDQNIDEPSSYHNNGKYPLIIANSCLSGDLHINSDEQNISSQWTLINKKGAIAFAASADIGFPGYLHQLSKSFFESLSYRKYHQALGDVLKDAEEKYEDFLPSNIFAQKTIFDFTLQGDPAIVIYSFEKPDLFIDESMVDIKDEPITTKKDSFDIYIKYQNIGRAFNNVFFIELTRYFPDGTSKQYNYLRSACHYSGLLKVRLAVDPIIGVGTNKLKIRLDALGQIDEIKENNNETEISFVIQSSDILPVYPYEYAIYPKQKVTLKASSADPFSPEANVQFQIDTTDAFNSPLLQTYTTKANGGIVSWDVPINLTDSTVYFWRVTKQGSNRWRESSFIYIKNKTGWSQAHHFQYKKDTYQWINYEKLPRKFSYITIPKELKCKNIGKVSASRLPELGYWIDGDGDYGVCGPKNTFTVVVIDSLSLKPWQSDKEDYGHRDYPQCSSRSRADLYFQFTSDDSLSMEDMAQFLNQIPENNHVLIYSIWNGNFKQLPENTKQAFENLYSATQIRNIENNIPYILYVKKGNESTAIEKIGISTTDEITLKVELKTDFDFGTISSTLIGPALKWESFHWRYKNNIDDKITKITILGLDENGEETELISNLTKDSLDVLNLSSRINAQQYPFLKLQVYCKDSIHRIPVQMKRWQVCYTEVPETAVEPDEGYSFYADTLEKGDKVKFVISTKNISPYPMDSLLVSFYVKDSKNKVSKIQEKRWRPHPSNDVITDTAIFNTIHSEGKNSIWVVFNAINEQTKNYDQLEQYHFNNLAIKYFYVRKDHINPLLHVTFDGVRIMDGDIVSPNPQILIRINDENKYLTMDDPNLVSVYLTAPGSTTEQKINITDSLGNQQLFWTPSKLPKNTAEMLFTPKDLKDGVYTLRVGATDASHNESGKFDYTIHFEVITKSSITHIFNYPNPFSTSTRFVFTLTGAELPDMLLVQIMTVTGKVVREIDLANVSHLHIGKNITDFAWDGRDEYGDLLANGVYFYRVYARLNGEEIENRKTKADQFFKKNIGKLYIIR